MSAHPCVVCCGRLPRLHPPLLTLMPLRMPCLLSRRSICLSSCSSCCRARWRHPRGASSWPACACWRARCACCSACGSCLICNRPGWLACCTAQLPAAPFHRGGAAGGRRLSPTSVHILPVGGGNHDHAAQAPAQGGGAASPAAAGSLFHGGAGRACGPVPMLHPAVHGGGVLLVVPAMCCPMACHAPGYAAGWML